MNEIAGRGSGQRQDEQRTCEGLEETKQPPINPNEISEIMAILADGVVELAAIHSRPRRQGKERDKENREPERELHSPIRPPCNGVNLHADAVMRKGFQRGTMFKILL